MIESNQIESLSVHLAASDTRCRYWHKIIRAGVALPVPSACDSAAHLPGGFGRSGDEELFPGDVAIQGEEMHHRHNRGWGYWLTYCGSDGKWRRVRPTAEHKAALKGQGLDKSLLAGAGELAACVRIVHALRAGLTFCEGVEK